MNANDNVENKNIPVPNNDSKESEITQNLNSPLENTSNDEETTEQKDLPISPEKAPVEDPQPDETPIEEPEKPKEEPVSDDNLNKVDEIKEDNPNLDDSDLKKEEEEEEEDTIKSQEEGEEEENAPLTLSEIVKKMSELSEKDKFTRKELDKLQYLFLNESRKEIEAQKENFIAEGGKEEDFSGKESELHTQGKALLQKLVEKRKLIAANEEALKEKNLERKLAIIEEVKQLTESQDDFNKTYQEFKGLQQEWNEIKLVPHGKEHELWKSFQQQVEKFYDLVRIHNEFRDYDFKKNLEAKSALCEAAERLLKEEDLVSAFHQLQKLHKDWRDIGPVARKDREVIWQRFKDISAQINKNYQSHIEKLKEQESENYEKKLAICEELESIDYSTLKSTKDWDSMMKKVLALQAQWRELGYAPRKVNAKVFQRYRAACDLFFKNKNDYYQSIRGELEENLKKKIELCERAEAMKDSQDWKKTTADMIAIQREWKEIGMVPRKHSSSVWKRFITACDYFFEQKKFNTKSQYKEELENLNLKKEVVEKIKNIDPSLSHEEVLKELRELMTEWQGIGFVPFNEKDKAYKEFTAAADEQYARLNIGKAERKLETFKSNILSDRPRGQVLHERDKLMRQYERMKSELQTYENNVGFLSSSSKKGNVLVDDMNNKIEKIKAELDLIVKKIEAIDDKI